MTMPKILTQEPDPRGQICGEPKAPGLYFCREHHEAVLDEYGEIRMAPGNAIGK